jgi:phage tail sheath protein FI
MSSPLTYPGVYIQEAPSVVHTIVPVPTAVTAFIGRTRRGDPDEAVRIHSYSDFQRTFGGRWDQSELPFAVQQYFANGGSDAYVVRAITRDLVGASAAYIAVQTPAGYLAIGARNPGKWFENVTIVVDLNTRRVNNVRLPDEFNLTITYREIDPVTRSVTPVVETFPNVSYLSNSANYVTTVLESDSRLVRTVNGIPQAQPIVGAYSLNGPSWVSGFAYAIGSVIHDANGNEQVVTQAGTTGRSQPGWGIAVGATTTDGTVQWVNQGPVHFALWRPNAVFQLNQVIFANGVVQQVTAVNPPAGSTIARSGAVAPAWVGGGATIDNEVTWTDLGVPDVGVWLPGNVYVLGAQIIDVNGDVQVVTAVVAPGKSSAAFGTVVWSSVPGTTTVDTNVTWTNAGPSAATPWQPRTVYPTSAAIFDENGGLQHVNAAGDAGISGDTQPLNWGTFDPTPGAVQPTTNDAAPLVWTALDMSGFSDGAFLTRVDVSDPTLEAQKQGMYALKDADIFTLMVLPPYAPNENGGTLDFDPNYNQIWSDALTFCDDHRAILLVDPPSPRVWNDEVKAYEVVSGAASPIDNVRHKNSTLYYPWLIASDPLIGGRNRPFAPSATIAGVIARTDGTRGVWKSPAGQEAKLFGIAGLQQRLDDPSDGNFNPLGINCLRTFPIISSISWGARTLDGADAQASQWKYLSVRRLALHIEESVYRATKWAVFEPNDEPLWAELRLNIGSFMRSLFRRGAFRGKTAKEAYFVKCDSTTTTDDDVNRGVVNVLIGFKPLPPAEYVVITISQIAATDTTS